jgi:hypothetical protein
MSNTNSALIKRSVSNAVNSKSGDENGCIISLGDKRAGDGHRDEAVNGDKAYQQINITNKTCKYSTHNHIRTSGIVCLASG